MILFRWIDQLRRRWEQMDRFQRAKRWHVRMQARPGLLALEPRRVLNAAPMIPHAAGAATPAQVVVNAGRFANDGKVDTFVVSRTAAGDAVSVNGQLQQIVPAGEKLVIQGSSDGDHVEIDFSNGTPLETNSIQFVGAGGANSILLVGSAQSVTHTLISDGTGLVGVDAASLTYSAGVTVTDSLSVSQRTFVLNGAENIALSASSAASLNEVRGQFGQDIQFVNSSAALTIDDSANLSSANQIAISGFESGASQQLTINASITDTVVLSGQIHLQSNDLHISAGVIEVQGQIEANSADVQFSATAQLTIDVGASISDRGGSIVADAGLTGALFVSGTLDVSNLQFGQVGGAIHLLGNDVALTAAIINARGDAGGGTILVGGSFQGKTPTIHNAAQVIVDENSILNASADRIGDGGQVIVRSNISTQYGGTIIATGGREGGNGGNAEVSGGALNFQGLVGLTAPVGAAGTLLIDPHNITVTAGGADPVTTNQSFTDNPGTDATFDAAQITAILDAGTNLRLQANNDITINQAIVVNNAAHHGGNLTLEAGRSIFILVDITTNNGDLNIIANQTLANNVQDASRDAGISVLSMAAGTTIDTGTGAATFHLNTGFGLTHHDSGDLTLANINSGQLIVQNDLGQVLDVSTSISVVNNANLTGTSIAIGGTTTTTRLGSLTFNSTGSVSIQVDNDTTLVGVNTAGSLNLSSDGVIADNSTSLQVENNARFSGMSVTIGGTSTATNLGSLTFNSLGLVAIQVDSNLELAGINTAGDLVVASSFAITDGSTSLSVANHADFSGVSVTLGGSLTTTKLGSLTFHSSGVVTIQVDSGTTLAGENTAGALTLSVDGGLTDSSTSLAVTNQAIFSGAFLKIGGLSSSTTVGTLTFSSTGPVTIQLDSDLVLAGDNTARSLALASSGALTDQSTSLNVVNNASFSGASIAIGGSTSNTNLGTVTFNSAGAVRIQVDSKTTLEDDNTAASLTLNSQGDITDGSNKLTVTNNASFSGTALTIGNPVTITNLGSLTFNSSGAVAIREDSSLTLLGNNSAGSLSLTSAGVLSDNSSSLTVTDNASFSGTSITLGGSATSTNLRTLTFNSPGAVSIQVDSGTQLAGVSTAASLRLSSTGAITDDSRSVTVTNNASFSGSSIAIGGSSSTTDLGSLTFTSSGTVVIQEDSGTVLAGDNTASSLNLNSAAAITDLSTNLTVNDNASFSGTLIAVGSSTTTTRLGSVTFNSPGSVTIEQDNDTSLAGDNDAGSLNIVSAGVIADQSTSLRVLNHASFSGTSITIGGSATTTNLGTLTFNSLGPVVIQVDSTLALAGINSAGNLTLISSDAIIDGSASLFVANNASFSGTAVTLGGSTTTTKLGSLTFNSIGSVTIQVDSGTTLAGDNTAQSLALTVDGGLKDSSTSLAVTNNARFNGAFLQVGGSASATTVGTLTFNSAGPATIQLDSDAVLVGDNTARSLTFESSGAVIDQSTSLAVVNNASFTGTSIIVGGSGTSTNLGTLTFNSPGSVTIQVDSKTTLEDDNTAASLSLNSQGEITDGSNSLTVAGNASFSGTAITIGSPVATTNLGSLTFNSSGAVAIREDSSMALFGDNTAGILSLTSTGAMTDDSTSLSVVNNASFTGALITIGGPTTNTNLGTLTFNSPGAVTIQEDSGTRFQSVSTAATLSLFSAGAITDDSRSLTVINNASFSGTSIAIGGSSSTTDLGSLTFNSPGAVSIQEDSSAVLAGDNTALSLNLSSAGTITDLSTRLTVSNNANFTGTSIAVGSSTAITKLGSLTLNSPGSVTIQEDDDTSLAGNNFAGSFSVTSSGSITESSGSVSATTIELVAAGTIGMPTRRIQVDTTTLAARSNGGIDIEQLASGGNLTIGTVGSTSGLDSGIADGDIEIKVDAGSMSVDGTIQAGTGTVRLLSRDSIVQTAAIMADKLGVVSGTGNIDLSLPGNNVGTLAAQAMSAFQSVNFQNASQFFVGQVSAGGLFNANLNGIVVNQSTGTVRLQSVTGDINQTSLGAIVANTLGADAKSGDVILSAAQNDVQIFAAKGNSVCYRDINTFQLGSVTKSGGSTADRMFATNPGTDLMGITAPNTIDLIAGGDLVLNASLASQTIRLVSETGSVSQLSGTSISANALSVRTEGDVDLRNAGNSVNTFAAIAGANVYFNDTPVSQLLTIGKVLGDDCVTGNTTGIIANSHSHLTNSTVELLVNNGDLRLQQAIQILHAPGSENETVNLKTVGGSISQSTNGVIEAQALTVQAEVGQQSISLDQAPNNVRSFAASATRDIKFNNQGSLAITTIAGGIFNAVVPVNFVSGVTSTNGGDIVITTNDSAASAADGDLSVLTPVDSNGHVQLTGQHSVMLAANVGNANTASVTIATTDPMTGTAISRNPATNAIIFGESVNLQAAGGIGSGSTANFHSELQSSSNGHPKGTEGNDINWNRLLGGNPNAIYVSTSTLNVYGPTADRVVNGDVWLDINPPATAASVELTPLVATGNVVITSGLGNHSGSIRVDSITSGQRILIETDTGTVQGVSLYLGSLTSAMPLTPDQNLNAIAVDTDGTLHQIDELPGNRFPFAIQTGKMLLLQLQANTTNPITGTFDASTVNGLAGIYADHHFFQIRAPFPSPTQALITPSTLSSIIATYGKSAEYGWNVTIVWGDGSQTPAVAYISQAGDATAPVTLSHLYPSGNATSYNLSLIVSVNPSISLAQHTASNHTYFEQQTLNTTVSAVPPVVPPIVPPPLNILAPSKEIPSQALLVSPRPVMAATIMTTDTAGPNVLKNLFVAENEMRFFNSGVQHLEKRRFLTLSLIPEDGSEPVLVSLLQDGKPTSQFDLEILLGDQLIEQFKNLPDGRYRLDLYRTLGNEFLDERTVLETVITNGVPSNAIEDLIEQLRRSLDLKNDGPDDGPANGQGALPDAVPHDFAQKVPEPRMSDRHSLVLKQNRI